MFSQDHFDFQRENSGKTVRKLLGITQVKETEVPGQRWQGSGENWVCFEGRANMIGLGSRAKGKRRIKDGPQVFSLIESNMVAVT